jgi:hypothetical protein
VWIGSAPAAFGGSDLAPLNVSATVVATARIVSGENLTALSQDPSDSSAYDAAASLTVRATKGLPYRIYLGREPAATNIPDGFLTLEW